ncbi:uncharacterized protein LOC144633369 [Oculina patagonica]
MSADILLDTPFRPNSHPCGGELSVSMLKTWLSSYGHPSTTAGPIVASTITIEAIQDLLHANGFPIEAPGFVDMCPGPFEDTQFDAVIDVETSDDCMDNEELKFTDLDACSEYGYGSADLSDDEISFFQDLPLSPDSPLLNDTADIDFGFDSGIEAEMDEPHDGAEEKDEKKEKSKSCEEKKSSDKSNQEEPHTEKQSASKPDNKDTKAEDKEKEVTEPKNEKEEEEKEEEEENEDKEDEELPHFHCQYLWEFLHHILLEKHNKYITWKNQSKGVFRLIDHNGLARLWGRQKNRKNMTYEKLSRALRYYYSKNILKKVPGQRLTYKFVRNLNGKKYPL